jgi:CBS domain-containing protein
MSPPLSLEPDLPINRFVDEILPMHRFASFPVAHNRQLLGILSLADLKKIPRERWRSMRAREVMRAVNSSLFVPENATIESANELVEHNGIGAVAVIGQQGELVGFFRRGRLRKK